MIGSFLRRHVWLSVCIVGLTGCCFPKSNPVYVSEPSVARGLYTYSGEDQQRACLLEVESADNSAKVLLVGTHRARIQIR
jgi:hypothetical protein